MKRFCLSVGVFLLLLSGSLTTLAAITALVPKADAQVRIGDGNGFVHYTTLQATFIDAAHIQVKASGTWPNGNGGNGIDLSVFSGMYYLDDVNQGYIGGVYKQGGDKKVGVPNGCQSSVTYTPASKIKSLPAGPTPVLWSLNLPPTGTTNTKCVRTDFNANDRFYQNARVNNPGIPGGAASNIRFYLADLSTMNEVDNDPAYDSKMKNDYTLKKVANGSITIATGDQFLYDKSGGGGDKLGGKADGGQCPDYIKLTNINAGPGLISGDLMDQKVSGNNCTPGGKKGSYMILANTPDEIAKGNLSPPTTNGGGSTSDPNGGLDNKCPLKEWWQLNWIACPIIENINSFINGLSNSIQQAVLLPADDLFGNGESAQNFKTAFNAFRAIGLSILIAAALAVIASQASGFEFINALSVKRFMPQFFGLVILISLMYPIEKLGVEAVNGAAVWIPSAMYAPFAHAYGNLQAVSGWSFLGGLATGAGAIAALGPFATLSLLVTAFLVFVTAALTITIVKMAAIGALIAAPAAIAFKAIPNLEFIWDFVKGVLKGATAFFFLVPIVFALSKIMAILLPGGNGILNALGRTFIILIPFGALPALAQRAGGALATITGMVNDRSRGAFDRLKNYRKSTLQQRGAAFKAGSLYQDKGIVRSRVNTLGRRMALGHKGFYPAQSRALMAFQQAVDAENAAKNNPHLQQLANNDDANAVLGLSGGNADEGRRAARRLFRDAETGAYDAERGEAAFKAAQAVGFNRSNSAYAFKSMMQNKARAVGAGDIGAIQMGARNLAGNNQEMFNSLMYEAAFHARGAGRADLGGASYLVAPSPSAAQSTDASIRALQAQAATQGNNISYQQAQQHLAVMDGMGRTTVGQMLNGHTNQAKADVRTLGFMLNNGNAEQRVAALQRVNEIAKNLSQASGDTQKIFNDFLVNGDPDDNIPGLGINMQSQEQFSSQLARLHGGPGIGNPADFARAIEAGSRTYGNEMAYIGNQNNPQNQQNNP